MNALLFSISQWSTAPWTFYGANLCLQLHTVITTILPRFTGDVSVLCACENRDSTYNYIVVITWSLTRSLQIQRRRLSYLLRFLARTT
jgi:hypothetical protein